MVSKGVIYAKAILVAFPPFQYLAALSWSYSAYSHILHGIFLEMDRLM